MLVEKHIGGSNSFLMFARESAHSHQQALYVMRKGRGSHFDPDVLDAFFEIEAEFARIAIAFADAGTETGSDAEAVASV